MAVNSVNSIRNQENRTRNTAIATIAGAGVGAIGGALTYSPFKGDELKDSFVKQAMLKEASNDNTKEIIKQFYDILEKGKKLADDKGNFTPENAREYLSNLKDSAYVAADVIAELTGEELKPEDAVKKFDTTIIKSASDEAVVNTAKYSHNDVIMDIAKENTAEAKSYFDGKKLKDLGENATEFAKNRYNAIKSAIKSNKAKAAAITGAIGAIVCGVGAYLLTNKKSNEAKKAE